MSAFARKLQRAAVTSPPVPPSGWPDSTNTGPSGALTNASGGVTLSTNGQVYENMNLTGYIVVEATNVIIRNCRVNSQSFWGIRVAVGGSADVIDTEVIGDPDGTGCIWANGGQVDVLRCETYGAEDGVRIEANNCSVRDSYIHGLAASGGSPHHDAMNVDGYTGTEVVHNRILNSHGQTSCIYLSDALVGSPSENLFQNNYVAGGGWTIYAGPSTGAGIRVLNNVFSTQYFPNCGSLGVVANWQAGGNTWSGNTWYDGLNAGQTVNP